MLPEDIMNKIYTIYYSNHVLEDLKNRVNKIINTYDKTYDKTCYTLIEFEKPTEIYSGYVVTNIARYYHHNHKIVLSNMYIALSNQENYLRTFKSILTSPPIIF